MRAPVRLRVTAIVHQPLADVRRRITPDGGTRAYLAETAAGVLVTLERPWTGPVPTRRSIIRSLQRQLAELTDG